MSEASNTINEYKGYSLFFDVDNVSLRNRNRAVVMANMFPKNKHGEDKVPLKVTVDMLTYFSRIPPAERKEVLILLTQRLAEEGYNIQMEK